MSDSIEIMNLCVTPNGTQPTSYSWYAERRQEESGKWSYRPKGDDFDRATFAFRMGYTPVVGDVLVCVYSCDNPELLTVPRSPSLPRIAGTDTTEGAVISQRMGWVAGRISTPGNNELWIVTDCGWVTLEGCAAYSPEDWEHVRILCDKGELRYPWFDGTLYANGGGGYSLLAFYAHRCGLAVVA